MWWPCPGPEWPPETETCGRMLPKDERCKECMHRRTMLRKADQRAAAREARKRAKAEAWA